MSTFGEQLEPPGRDADEEAGSIEPPQSPAEEVVHVRSAGSDPAEQINWTVIRAMEELGIDPHTSFRSRSPTRLCGPPMR